MGQSRQTYYQGHRRVAAQAEKAQVVLDLVRGWLIRQPRMGARKLHDRLKAPLQKCGLTLGRDALFDLLRQARMLVPQRRAYHKTTNSHHRFHWHPNLLKTGPEQIWATGCEQVWVADITYLPTETKCVYLSLVTDAYSRKTVCWYVHNSLQTEEVTQAYRIALRQRKTRQELVHHSDRGGAVLRRVLPAVAREAWGDLLDDRRLRLLPKCIGGAGEWDSEDGATTSSSKGS